MCGICGYINYREPLAGQTIIQAMAKIQSHRGPDDMGVFTYHDTSYQVALGHVRLSILDLSEQGHQPMTFLNSTIVFNGEIYNFKELKEELIKKGHTFTSNCDTEVVLHAYHEWGADCVSRFIGMFAFAIYDKDRHQLVLCRDRAGIKPLYYYHDKDTIIFGSELKVFHQHPHFKKVLHQGAASLYMKSGYIPAPYTIFDNTKKLQQGCYLTINLNTRTQTLHPYWRLREIYSAPKLEVDYETAKTEVENLLRSSFNYRMVSDVPVGVFLSAGFDSTCVAALLQADKSRKIKTFTIGFESGSNEAPRAKAIASYLGTDHTEYYCTIKEALELTDSLPYYYDEPFADSSAIPTMLVSKVASKDVSVVLSADGGDEIFAGYSRYDNLLRRYEQLKKIPHSLYKPYLALTKALGSLSLSRHAKWRFELISDILGEAGDDLQSSFVRNMFKRDLQAYHEKVFSFDSDPEFPVLSDDMHEMDFLSKLLYIDYSQYMCDDILVKVDRATMSVSIEGRDPFLDQRIIEYAARIPSEYKYDGTVKKRILKEIVYKYVPRELMDMPKKGFSVPLADWLGNGLKEYVNHYLSEDAIAKTGVFHYDFIKHNRERFDQNPQQYATILWKQLQMQMWYERWMQ